MPKPDEWFLYYQVWEGLSPTFPFAQFDTVDNAELDDALIKHASAWLWQKDDRLREYIARHRVEREDATVEQLAEETKAQIRSIEGFWRIARLAGWRRGDRKEWIRSSRRYFHQVEGADFAATAAGVLRTDAQEYELQSLRIGLVDASQLSVVERVRIRMEIEVVRTTGKKSESLAFGLYERAQRAETHARSELSPLEEVLPVTPTSEIKTISDARSWLITKDHLAKALGLSGHSWLGKAWKGLDLPPARRAPGKGGFSSRYCLGELHDSFIKAAGDRKVPELSLTPKLLRVLEAPNSVMPWEGKHS